MPVTIGRRFLRHVPTERWRECATSMNDEAVNFAHDECWEALNRDFGITDPKRWSKLVGQPILAAQAKRSHGPGLLVKLVLQELGIKPKSGCGCRAFAAKMNAWGWGGCLTHTSEIVTWFAKKAKEYEIEVSAGLILKTFWAAWSVWKKKATGE